MRIDALDVHGMMVAMGAMRNPMSSWGRSDTVLKVKNPEKEVTGEAGFLKIFDPDEVIIGSNDKELSMKLQKAGPEHCKHLRMVMVWADIEAPRYWWQEFDTYRHGVEKVSCSTMHKLTSREIVSSDFEFEQCDALAAIHLQSTIRILNELIGKYKEETDEERRKGIWRNLIQSLPQSYIQKRTVMMSYAALRNIVRQREGHKLKEWKAFIDWAHKLPESWMIFDEE